MKKSETLKSDSTSSVLSSEDLAIHELHKLDDFPSWTSIDDFAFFMYESLKPYEDPIELVKRGTMDALQPKNREPSFVLLAEINKKIVGGLIMLRTGMKGYIPENFLLMVAVSPSTRGMGIGAQIIKKAFELADGDVKLHVEYDNPAKRLYERLGMTTKYAEMRLSK